MEFLLSGEVYSIPDAILMNSSPPPYTSASPFGFDCAENSQLQHQKPKNPAENESISPVETQGFKISSNVAQAVQDRPVPVSMPADFTCAEATSVTATELRRPSVSLSVNGAGMAKVRKKRSRTSRKAPTTLLNTDTTNFRAMVQRFTGFRATPFGISSMNPTFSANVGQQELQLIGNPLFYKTVLDRNVNCVSHLNSVPDSYGSQQYNSTAFLPFQFLHDNINIYGPLNLFPRALEGNPQTQLR